MALQKGVVLPLWQFRQLVECLADRLGQQLARQAFGERIDRFDQRQAGEFLRRYDMVGMRHLWLGAIPVDAARDETPLAFRQHTLQAVHIAVKEHQCQRASVVLHLDAVGQALVEGRRRLVAAHRHFHGDYPVARQVGDARAVAPVHQAGRQMQQQVDDARGGAATAMRRPEETRQQLVEFLADALEAGGPGKQRIEDRWTHGRSFVWFGLRRKSGWGKKCAP